MLTIISFTASTRFVPRGISLEKVYSYIDMMNIKHQARIKCEYDFVYNNNN